MVSIIGVKYIRAAADLGIVGGNGRTYKGVCHMGSGEWESPAIMGVARGVLLWTRNLKKMKKIK